MPGSSTLLDTRLKSRRWFAGSSATSPPRLASQCQLHVCSWQVRIRKCALKLCHSGFECTRQRKEGCAVTHDSSVLLARNSGENDVRVVPVLSVPRCNGEYEKLSFAHRLQANLSTLDLDRSDFAVHDSSCPIAKHESQILSQFVLEFPIRSAGGMASFGGGEQLSQDSKETSHCHLGRAKRTILFDLSHARLRLTPEIFFCLGRPFGRGNHD